MARLGIFLFITHGLARALGSFIVLFVADMLLMSQLRQVQAYLGCRFGHRTIFVLHEAIDLVNQNMHHTKRI